MSVNQTPLNFVADEESVQVPPANDDGAFSWVASEYIDHKQSAGWFILLSLGTVLLAAAVYLITRDYFATAVTAIAGLIVGVFAARTPKQLTYELSPDGLRIEQKTYPYDSFKSFALISDGGMSSIDLLRVKRYMPAVSAYFAPADEQKIVNILQNNLPYEQRQLDGVERLTRRLRF